MARPVKPQEAEGELPAATDLSAALDSEALIAQSRKPGLERQPDRALGALARRIRAARDAAREQGDDPQAVKDLGAALRRVRAEVTRRSEAEPGAAAGGPDQPGAVVAAGARPARAPGLRAGRPGARKVPKPPQGAAETAAEPATGAGPLPRAARPAGTAAEPAALSQAAAPAAAPRRAGKPGAGQEDKAEKKARKEAEKAERKRVKEAEKTEEKAARKLQKEAEKAAGKAERQAGKKAGKRTPEPSEA